MLEKIQLLIFDVDGTLLNSVKFNYKNINQTLARLGYTYRVKKEQVEAHLGCTAEDYYKGILDEGTYQDWELIRQETRKHTEKMMREYGEAFVGVSETFKALYEKGILLVLYSNCSRPYLDAAIEVTGVAPYIDYAECVKENGLKKSELIAKILKRYQGMEAAVVGDRIHDVEAAHANHLLCVGAAYGFGKGELEESDFRIQNIGEIVDLYNH